MRTNSSSGSQAPASSAAFAAFQVAFVQQKRFEETLAKVNEKQVQANKESNRKADRTADVVDVKKLDNPIENHQAAQNASKAASAPVTNSVGAKLNLSV